MNGSELDGRFIMVREDREDRDAQRGRTKGPSAAAAESSGLQVLSPVLVISLTIAYYQHVIFSWHADTNDFWHPRKVRSTGLAAGHSCGLSRGIMSVKPRNVADKCAQRNLGEFLVLLAFFLVIASCRAFTALPVALDIAC
jgi:hypothetical protein